MENLSKAAAFTMIILLLAVFQAKALEIDYNAIINSINEDDIDVSMLSSMVGLDGMPEEVKGIIGNEKVNIYIDGIDRPLYAALSEGKLVDAGIGARDEATMRIDTDTATLEKIVGGEKTFQEALKDGSIRYSGLGFVNSVKFAIINLLMWFAGIFGMI